MRNLNEAIIYAISAEQHDQTTIYNKNMMAELQRKLTDFIPINLLTQGEMFYRGLTKDCFIIAMPQQSQPSTGVFLEYALAYNQPYIIMSEPTRETYLIDTTDGEEIHLGLLSEVGQARGRLQSNYLKIGNRYYSATKFAPSASGLYSGPNNVYECEKF